MEKTKDFFFLFVLVHSIVQYLISTFLMVLGVDKVVKSSSISMASCQDKTFRNKNSSEIGN